MDFSDELIEVIAEPLADYIMVGDRRFMEPWEENTEVMILFGKMDGKVVIKSIMVPSFYPQSEKDNFVFNIRQNNRKDNCPLCESVSQRISTGELQ